jgi:hypothetical protein
MSTKISPRSRVLPYALHNNSCSPAIRPCIGNRVTKTTGRRADPVPLRHQAARLDGPPVRSRIGPSRAPELFFRQRIGMKACPRLVKRAAQRWLRRLHGPQRRLRSVRCLPLPASREKERSGASARCFGHCGRSAKQSGCARWPRRALRASP